jgi:hypothetical protein
MTAILYPLYAVAQAALLAWGVRLWPRSRSLALGLLLLVGAALVYDNLIIAIGRLLGEGSLLHALNWPRFLFHALLTPLLLVTAVYQAGRGGISWAAGRVGQIAAWVVALGLILFGIIHDLVGLSLSPTLYGGTLRYAAESSGPPIPAIITIVIIMVVGIFVWRQLRWPWMFVGALVMFIGAAVPPSIVGPAVGSGVEIALLAGLLATEQRLTMAVNHVSLLRSA